MLINYKLLDQETPLQVQQLTELESLATREYKTKGRKIFDVHNSLLKRIKWNRPTKQMLKELHNRSQPKIVHINTASTKYLDHCNTEAIQADNGYEFLTRMYTRLSHAVLNLKPRAEYTETRRIKYNLNKANAS